MYMYTAARQNMGHGLSMWDEEKNDPVQRWTEHLYFYYNSQSSDN